MSIIEKRRSPVYRQLEAYGEYWKRDHDEAMACRDWEDAIALGLSIVRVLGEREQAWRDQVFRGVVPYAEDDNLDQQARFADWLATTRHVLSAVLPGLERRFGQVEGADDLRQSAARAEELIGNWQPPRLSKAVGLREMTLSPEGAAEFERLLREARSLPPEGPPGPAMQVLSAAEFLRRKS